MPSRETQHGLRLNIFKHFYGMVVGLLSRLHIYEERTDKYLNHFKHHVDDERKIVDVGCGTGAFSKALASNRHLVIALDIESRLLRGFDDPYIEKVCADAQQLPLRDGLVDAVLSHFSSILKTQINVCKSFTGY